MFFHNPEYLPWIIILVFFGLIYILQIQIRERKLKKWLGKQQAFLRSSISDKKRHIKMGLRISALLFFILALARPQIPGEKVDVERAGIYITLMVDISQSMLAEDVKPNRLAFMKQELSHFLDLSKGDQVSLIAFAQSPTLIAPFTSDLSAIKSYLMDLSPDYFSSKGTHFGRAFSFAEKLFKNIREKRLKKSMKIIVLASDGEDHSSSGKEKIKNLLKNGVRVFTLSFGTKKGGVIPIKNNRNEVTEYKKNYKGELVISKLNDEDLRNFAKWGKGAYYHIIYGGEFIKQLRSDINKLEKTTFETSSVVRNKEIYFWFLILGFFLALSEIILSDRKLGQKDQN